MPEIKQKGQIIGLGQILILNWWVHTLVSMQGYELTIQAF